MFVRTIRGLRWYICALLFFATSINYIDRQVFSILAPDLQKTIGGSEVEYGYIVTSFQAAYAGGYFIAGRIMDSIPTRQGFAIILGLWSVAAMAHAGARSAIGFGIARAALGLGEAVISPHRSRRLLSGFPSRNALWLPEYSTQDPTSAPSLPPSSFHGSRFGTDGNGSLDHRRTGVSVANLLALDVSPSGNITNVCHHRSSQHIRSDPPEKTDKVAWAKVFPALRRAFAIGKFLTDPVCGSFSSGC